MFSLNNFSLVFGLQKACRDLSLSWLSGETYPLEPTSKQVTLVLNWSISVTKWAYFSDFSLFLLVMLGSRGHVSSKICMDFFFSSMITMSGLRGVTRCSTGMVPAVTVW